MNDDEIQERLNRTVAVVEATHTEQFYLWKEWAKESGWFDATYPSTRDRKMTWEQMNPGVIITVAKVARMPVCLSLTWNRIEGQVVLFWEMCSMVTDARPAEKWLKDHLKPWPTYDNGSRHASFDAMNFGNATHAIRQAAGTYR